MQPEVRARWSQPVGSVERAGLVQCFRECNLHYDGERCRFNRSGASEAGSHRLQTLSGIGERVAEGRTLLPILSGCIGMGCERVCTGILGGYDARPMCRGTVAAIRCPGSMQARRSGCATADQRLSPLQHQAHQRISDSRGAQTRTLRQSLLLRDLSGRDGEITWHGPRHTFYSWLEMAGETAIEIKEPAGHKTMSQGARYAHLSPKHKQSVVDQIAVTLTESKIAGCRRGDHTKHAPALQWQERSEVK